MPSRQNARRWRRLDWDEIEEGIQDPPAPIEEPDFEPAPEPIQVTAEAVPLPTEFSVVVEAEVFTEPETRVQFITNPDHKQKHNDLIKKHRATTTQLKETAEGLDEAFKLIDKQNDALEKGKNKWQKRDEDDIRFKQDILYVDKITADMFRTLSQSGAGLGDIEIHFHCGSTHAEIGAPYPRPDITMGKAGALEGSKAITITLGSWIGLLPCYKYYLCDFRNYGWWELINDETRKAVSNMVWKIADIEKLGKHQIAMEGHNDADGGQGSWEAFFSSLVCGFDMAAPGVLQQGQGLLDYMKSKGLNLHEMSYEDKQKLVGQFRDDQFTSTEWVRDFEVKDPKWEAAKNSIINL